MLAAGTPPPTLVADARWESRTVDLGTPVHYADFGGSGPVMVLVHGIASSHLNWMGIGPRLAANHRVFAVDLPGYGLSELRDPATVHNSQKYLDGFIDHVSGGREVVLFGHSMGGLVSLAAGSRARPLRGIGHMAQMEDEDLVLNTVREWQLAQKFMGPSA